MRRTGSQAQEITARAARLLAEGHTQDIGAAKHKAAQQLGLSAAAKLPSDQDVEKALAQHRAIFEPEHENLLRQLRQKSLYLMRFFADFHPFLTGSVLSGAAGLHSDINLILYLDDPKAIEIFLIGQKIEYRYQNARASQRSNNYPTLAFLFDETPVTLHVRPLSAQRNLSRHEVCASRIEVEKLLAGSIVT